MQTGAVVDNSTNAVVAVAQQRLLSLRSKRECSLCFLLAFAIAFGVLLFFPDLNLVIHTADDFGVNRLATCSVTASWTSAVTSGDCTGQSSCSVAYSAAPPAVPTPLNDTALTCNVAANACAAKAGSGTAPCWWGPNKLNGATSYTLSHLAPLQRPAPLAMVIIVGGVTGVTFLGIVVSSFCACWHWRAEKAAASTLASVTPLASVDEEAAEMEQQTPSASDDDDDDAPAQLPPPPLQRQPSLPPPSYALAVQSASSSWADDKVEVKAKNAV